MEKLLKIQTELKAPKNLRNSFGNYNYRNCESILEAVKPLLKKYNCTLVMNDEIVNIGDRYYVKSTATIGDLDTFTGQQVDNQISVTAYAREADAKKGMEDAMLTGSTSSYARKYALNGLFLIDDTKDADTDEYQNEKTNRTTKAKSKSNAKSNEFDEELQKPITDVQKKVIEGLIEETKTDRAKFIAWVGKDVDDWNGADYAKGIKGLEKKRG